MDYSKFYHDWLQLDLVPEEVPNLYRVLGLNNMEPDKQKIEAAFQSTLDTLQNVNGMTNPEAYTAIVSRVLEARKVFANPKQKHEYDVQLSQNTGERVWKGYVRPSFFTRVRQMALLAFSFALGLGVMAVMAITVERNPDGSIIFHEEAQARKAPPFASQLEYVVFRPSIAQDYQPNGYAVAVNKPAHHEESPLMEAPSETSGSKAETSDSDLLDLSEIAENQDTQSEMDEFSQILSEKIATPKSETITKVNRRSPLYRNTAAVEDDPSEETVEESSGEPEDVTSENSEPEQEIAANTDAQEPEESLDLNDPQEIEAPAVESTPKETVELVAQTNLQETTEPEDQADQEEIGEPAVQKTAFSLTSVISLLDDVHSRMDFSKPNSAEAYALLQYSVIREFLQKLIEEDVTVNPEEIKPFMDYTMKVATSLGWKKRFTEAYHICDMMKEFDAKYEVPQNLDETVARQYKSIQNYETLYQEAMGISEKLQQEEYANDKELNTKYAMWLWQETGDIQNSIRYFAKCKYTKISEAAQKEMKLAENGTMNDPQMLREIADSWWDVAEKQLTNERQKAQVKEHAKKYYLKVLEMDSSLLSDVQKARVVSL